MSALTANRDTGIKDGIFDDCGVKTATHIYAGALVCVESSSGYLVNASDTSGLIFAGVATDEYDATDEASGALVARFRRHGNIEVAYTGTAPTVGAAVCVSDNQTVALASVTTNDVAVGVVTKVSSGRCWVAIG